MFRKDPGSGSRSGSGSGSGSEIPDFYLEDPDPDPKLLISDPEHCFYVHCFTCRPSDTTVLVDLNPGPLQCLHRQPDTLTSRPDLIHIFRF